MRNITFKYIKDRKVTNKFMRGDDKDVNISWFLSKEFLLRQHIEGYSASDDKYDQVYIALVEKIWNWKYRVGHRTRDIWFDMSKKLVEKLSNILERYNFYYWPNQMVVYIWSSLKILLEKNGYIDYEWPIRVYWKFWSINTTKTNIGKIWKADILDKEGNTLETVESNN